MMAASLKVQLQGLATLSPAQLRDEWVRVHGSPCPHLPPSLLQLGIAYRLQESRHGGFPARAARELERVASGEPPRPAAAPLPCPGMQLVREWQGRMIRVEVVEGGFVWNGERYPSLSRIAKAVTGAHWSGPRFFGLTGRG